MGVMASILPCRDDERAAILHAAAEAYLGVIPPDRWHLPYMPSQELPAQASQRALHGARNAVHCRRTAHDVTRRR
jgi:hypothetical protein